MMIGMDVLYDIADGARDTIVLLVFWLPFIGFWFLAWVSWIYVLLYYMGCNLYRSTLV